MRSVSRPTSGTTAILVSERTSVIEETKPTDQPNVCASGWMNCPKM